VKIQYVAMCYSIRDFWGDSNFLGLCLGSSGYRQCLWSEAWRNNLASASRARSSIWKKTSEHCPRLKALRKSPSSRSLSPLDNCPEKAGRAYVTTDKTIAMNAMCRALRERPWYFNFARGVYPSLRPWSKIPLLLALPLLYFPLLLPFSCIFLPLLEVGTLYPFLPSFSIPRPCKQEPGGFSPGKIFQI